MPFKRGIKGIPSDLLAAKGLMYHDWEALTHCQRECTGRLGKTIQLEQEAYLLNHPEVEAMLQVFVSKLTRLQKRKCILKEAGEHYQRPIADLDKGIREQLKLPPDVPYIRPGTIKYNFEDDELENDLREIIMKHYPAAADEGPTPVSSVIYTESSSFLSVKTSDTTLPTPEPVRTPEPTLSEIFFNVVSNTVDKAIYSRVDEPSLRYDTAYVELMKAVEQAMEIPVIEIRLDIAELFYNAYQAFEMDILEKERIAAEIAWGKRMRKKLKRTLRRMDNFRGYETPPTPKSELSSHASYRLPMPRPCKCHPQFYYNRYEKDRFGIYVPRDGEFSVNNVTVTPAISVTSIPETQDPNDPNADTKSTVSRKSVVTNASKKAK